MSNYKSEDIITPMQASDESKIAYLTISRAIKAGKIPSTKTKNSITLVYKDFEKWWRDYQSEQNLIADKINKSREILEKLSEPSKKTSKVPVLYGFVSNTCTPSCGTGISKSELPLESDFFDNRITYICKSLKLNPYATANVEILSLVKTFRPSKITIKTTDLSSNKETFCEICNVHVLGEPQLISFNGLTDKRLRGSSLLFSDLDISNWGIFGSSLGQGLIIDVCNPNETEIEIEILVSGWETKSSYLCNRIWTNANKIAFSKITATKNSTSVMKVFAGRSKAFKPNFLKIQSYKSLKITNISVLKKQQIQFTTENSELSSDFFANLSKISFDCFGDCNSQGLEISFKNKYDHDVDVYLSILGEDVDEDLVGTR